MRSYELNSDFDIVLESRLEVGWNSWPHPGDQRSIV